ncbi:hypothetical protein ACVWWG_008623 [Bradyrhizobium sp. LB7.2]
MPSNVVARRCAMFFFALSVFVAGARHITDAHAAGAFAVGKCGAYGQAFGYGAEHEARAAAQKQCKGDCTTVTMKRACAAMAVDLSNPCGAYGYAVKPKISASLNAATRECYKFRRQGMCDPRLGLRRKGVIPLAVIPGRCVASYPE